jgi:hypothetical protein
MFHIYKEKHVCETKKSLFYFHARYATVATALIISFLQRKECFFLVLKTCLPLQLSVIARMSSFRLRRTKLTLRAKSTDVRYLPNLTFTVCYLKLGLAL